MSGRETILARVRKALADVPAAETPEDVPVGRDYRRAHLAGSADLTGILTERLTDYRARVHTCDSDELPGRIAGLLTEHGSTRIAVPDDLPREWLADLPEGISTVSAAPAAELDRVHTVVTGAALAVAETGTIVLDSGPGQGRRMLTLIPDHHVCVVRAGQILASVPDAIAALDPGRPQTWISGPSATSDIELERVEGVHGPRVLDVVLASDRGHGEGQ
jgi:L-lactate dehydrogenase complex protein LldG